MTDRSHVTVCSHCRRRSGRLDKQQKECEEQRKAAQDKVSRQPRTSTSSTAKHAPALRRAHRNTALRDMCFNRS